VLYEESRKRKKKQRLLERKKKKLEQLKLNKEKWEKYLKLREHQKEAREKAKQDRDSKKIFISGINFSDLENKQDKVSALNKTEERKKWMQRLLESFGPIQQLLTFWDKQYLFVIYKHQKDALKAFFNSFSLRNQG